jgi:hypothetical protein
MEFSANPHRVTEVPATSERRCPGFLENLAQVVIAGSSKTVPTPAKSGKTLLVSHPSIRLEREWRLSGRRRKMLNVSIKQVGQREGQDRFVLVNTITRKVLTVSDVSEQSLRRYFRAEGVAEEVIADCLRTARRRYSTKVAQQREPVDQGAETIEDEDLLFELGLEGDSDASIH